VGDLRLCKLSSGVQVGLDALVARNKPLLKKSRQEKTDDAKFDAGAL